MSSYRPRRFDQSSHPDNYPSPSRWDQRNAPPMYTFNTANGPRESGNTSRVPPPPDFTFRNSHIAPTFPSHEQPPRGPKKQKKHTVKSSGQKRTQIVKWKERQRIRALGASERPLMQIGRATTPEQFAGMANGDSEKFNPYGDATDSDEQDMEPDSSDDEAAATTEAKTNGHEGTDSAADEPPLKRQARGVTEAQRAENSKIPKWSNPDPYTVLPPTEDLQRKKKDVVKLIRKARVQSKTEATAKPIAENEDFISLNFDDDKDDGQSTESESSDSDGSPAFNPPQGPRSTIVDRFSHREHLQRESQHGPPGVVGNTLTSSALPPPPSASYPLPAVPGSIASSLQAHPPLPSAYYKNAPQAGYPGDSSTSAIPADVWPPPDIDAALGNRKRTYDDRIKGKVHKGKGPGSRPDGSILQKWKPVADENPTPWCGAVDHSKSEGFEFWLHKEICDFYNYIKPQDFEQTVRTDLVNELRQIVREAWPDSDILAFGSFAAGLYLPDSDMDLVMVSDRFMNGGSSKYDSKNHLYAFRDFISTRFLAEQGTLELVAGAKVPLVKFVDWKTGLRVDISFENTSGVRALRTFHEWKDRFPAMLPMVCLIKHFLAMRGLNEVFTGGLGGFSVTCLVVSLLQNMPQVASGNFIPENHLGEALMEFLDLYGNAMNFSAVAIRTDKPGYLDKNSVPGFTYNANKQDRLMVIDPHDLRNDLTGGSRNINTIRRCFSDAYRTLQKKMAKIRVLELRDRANQSLLAELFAGAYRNFEVQRERLREVHSRSDTSVLSRDRSHLLLSTNGNGVSGELQNGNAQHTRKRKVIDNYDLENVNPKVAKTAKKNQTSPALNKKGKKKLKNQASRISRAKSFKLAYPLVPDVPDELDKEAYKKLKNLWDSKGEQQPDSNSKANSPKKDAAKPKVSVKAGKDVKKTIKPFKKAEVVKRAKKDRKVHDVIDEASIAKRTRAAKYQPDTVVPGGSHSDPITLD